MTTGHNYLPHLAADIKAAHDAVGMNAKAMAEHALAAGRLLIEAKGKLNHGEFGPWLREHVDISERTARRYMTLAKSGVKTATVADLGINGAIEHCANVLKVPLPNSGECVFGDDGAHYLCVWHEPSDKQAEYLLAAIVGDNGADGMYRGIRRGHLHNILLGWPADEFDYAGASYERIAYAERAEFLESMRRHFWAEEVKSWSSMRGAA